MRSSALNASIASLSVVGMRCSRGIVRSCIRFPSTGSPGSIPLRTPSRAATRHAATVRYGLHEASIALASITDDGRTRKRHERLSKPYERWNGAHMPISQKRL